MRKICAAACEVLPFINPQEQIVPVDTSKLSNIISQDTAYVSSEAVQADIVINLGSNVVRIQNSASYSLIESVVKVLKNAR